MAIIVTDGGGSPRYLKSTGDGSDGTTNVATPHHIVDSIGAALPAGTNNVGDVDILTLVGDAADLDSGGGTDNHGLVAVGLPAAGGHVVGGTPTNPFRVDPVASTVMPVSVASFYVPINTVASVVGNPAVVGSVNVGNFPAVQPVGLVSQYLPLTTVASVVGNPAVIASIAGIAAIVGSAHIGNFPAVQPISIASQYLGLNAVASVIGAPTVIASIAGNVPVTGSIVGTIYAVVNTAGAVANVVASTIGTIFAVVNTGAAGVGDVSVRSQYIQLTTTASVIGNPAVLASIAGAPNVLASIPNVPSVGVASFYVSVNTVASQIGNAAVTASVVGNPAVIASVAGLPSVAIASINVANRPWTTGSMWSTVARVVASANDVAPVPARGAGVYNYITAISVINAAASYGGVINLQDGTATLHVGYAAPAGGGYVIPFPVPLKPAANATLFFGVPVYSLDLLISISGFQGA